MRALSALRGRARGRAAVLRPPVVAALLAAAALAGPAAVTSAPATAALAAGQSPAGGGCFIRPVPGGFELVCQNTGGTPGGPGTTGGSSTSRCSLVPLSKAQVRFLGLPWPAPKGQIWEVMTCPGPQPFSEVVLVSTATGVPAVTPQQLAQIAIAELIIPVLRPQTAPPRGRDGLVGLPEWFWFGRGEWAAVSKTVAVGPVWARATAVPVSIVFQPGGGQAGISCRGPGTAFDPARPLAAQHTDCSYTYKLPSAGQPGNVYTAAVTVLWNVFWVGSGNTGGPVASGRPVNTPLTLPVAAGEALVTGT
jgi:hypothetical protein